jgi:endonuclease/exonuclease/phosphatase family metal-dependent hydrolase
VPIINEFVLNHTGTDDAEYVEIIGEPLTDYGSYTLIQLEGDSAVAGTIDTVLQLGMTDPAGFYVPGFFYNEFENGTATLLLVEGFSGYSGQDLDTDNDGILDVTPWEVVADKIAVTDGGSDDRTYADVVLTPGFDGNPYTPGGASRIPDGADRWVRNDFDLAGVKVWNLTVSSGEALNTPGKSDREGPYTVTITPLSIPQIQGVGHLSDVNYGLVSTQGLVTAVAYDGYYVQDVVGDGDPASSDGLFVYEGVCSSGCPQVGDQVELAGLVHERIPGGAPTGNLSITTVFEPEETILSSANPPAEPSIIGQSGRIPPNVQVIDASKEPVNLQVQRAASFDPDTDGIDFYESLEGMLVQVDEPVAVSATRTFNSYSSEFFVLTNDGDDIAPEDAMNARGGIDLQPDPDNRGDQNPERVQIQLDGTLFPFDVPEVVVGDKLDDIIGVVGYSFGNFEVNALQRFDIEPSELEQDTTRLVGTRQQVTVATYNVLNLSPDESDDSQRATIAAQIVNHLKSPDVIALQEIQDNNGEIDDGIVAADQTLQALVDAIADADGPSYAFFDVAPVDGTSGGVPGGNIRNAYLYNPARVELVDYESLTPEALAAYDVSNPDAFSGTRNPLLATFKFEGKEFKVINNHLSSRFGSTPIFGGPQPFVQAGEAEREAQVTALNEVVGEIISKTKNRNPNVSKAPRIVVLGDLNTFQFTDDLSEMLPGTGCDQVLWNMVNSLTDDEVYSYNFEGNSQVLDHIFVSNLLRPIAQYDIAHVNVDYPRVDDSVASDHEPSLVRLNLRQTQPVPYEGDRCEPEHDFRDRN